MAISLGTGLTLGRRRGGGAAPDPDALFDTRTGLTITDSIGAQSLTVKSFPVCNYYSSIGTGWYTAVETGEAPITVTGDWSAIMVCRNEVSGTVDSIPDFLQLNGNNKGVSLYCRSGALYAASQIVSASADLGFNSSGKVVGQTEPWVLCARFNAATQTPSIALNGTQIDSVVDNNWRLGVAAGALNWRGYNNKTNFRFLGIWIIDRLVTDAEILEIANNGNFPAVTPSRQYVHLNYNDIVSNSLLGSHNRKKASFSNNAVNAIIPDRATMWTYRYDNPVFAYALKYGYTGYGNYKIPYSPAGAKMMVDAVGDIEFPASGCLHNMAESMIDFSGITDADIKAIFNKADRTYWNASIEATDLYALGAYLWHPSQLVRSFITAHAATSHANHIFAGLRTSGQCITGITSLRVYKTNLT